MKRIVAISDLHYGLKSGGYDRTDEIHSVMSQAVEYAIGVDADLFVCLGDLGHVANPPSRIHGLWMEIFDTLNEHGIEGRFILGNHDLIHRDSQPYGSLAPLVEVNYPFVRAVCRTDISSISEGVGCLYLPYMSKSNLPDGQTIDEYNELFLKDNEEKLNGFDTVLVFSHLNPPEYKPHDDIILRPIHATVPESVMSGGWATVVLNGHIHRPQTVRKSGPGFVVVGSPICTDFGDVLDKSFVDLLINDGSTTAINRIPSRNIPLVQLDFDFVDDEKASFPDVDECGVDNAGVKISIRCTEDQIGQIGLDRFIDKVKAVAKFVRPVIPLVVRRRRERDTIVDPDMTDIEAVEAWIKDRQPTGARLILKCGLEALEGDGV